jgi:uncharacterized protein
VSGLIVPLGPPGRVLRAARDRRFQLVISWQLAEELVEVLGRPRLARYDLDQKDVEAVVQLLAPGLPTVDIEVPIRDPDDAHVVAAALAGEADVIVTGDAHLLADEALRRWLAEREVAIITPTELLASLGET